MLDRCYKIYHEMDIEYNYWFLIQLINTSLFLDSESE